MRRYFLFQHSSHKKGDFEGSIDFFWVWLHYDLISMVLDPSLQR